MLTLISTLQLAVSSDQAGHPRWKIVIANANSAEFAVLTCVPGVRSCRRSALVFFPIRLLWITLPLPPLIFQDGGYTPSFLFILFMEANRAVWSSVNMCCNGPDLQTPYLSRFSRYTARKSESTVAFVLNITWLNNRLHCFLEPPFCLVNKLLVSNLNICAKVNTRVVIECNKMSGHFDDEISSLFHGQVNCERVCCC